MSVQIRADLLADGECVTMFPTSVANHYGLRALQVDFPVPRWPVAIVTLRNRSLSPVAERFIECAREVTKSRTSPSASGLNEREDDPRTSNWCRNPVRQWPARGKIDAVDLAIRLRTWSRMRQMCHREAIIGKNSDSAATVAPIELLTVPSPAFSIQQTRG